MPVSVLSGKDNFNNTINSGGAVAIYFWATWSGQCKIISPIFDKFSDMPGFSHIKFYKVDSDEEEDIFQDVGIKSMPTFVVFKDGQKIGQVIGANHEGVMDMLVQA